MNTEKYFDKFNIMIIGDEKVGKTSILERLVYFNYSLRYFNKKYTEDRKQTLGVECYEKDKYINNKKILIKIWDTAGQEKFAVMAKSFYQRAHGIILACALDNKNSFYNLRNWLNSIRDNTQAESIQLIILGNKCDLTNEREVAREDIENKARDLNVEFFEASAKENINLDEAFNSIIDKVYQGVYNRPQGFDLNSRESIQSESGRKCC